MQECVPGAMGLHKTRGISVVWSIPEVTPVALPLLTTVLEAKAFFPLHTPADSQLLSKCAAHRAAAQVIFQILYSRLFELLGEIEQAS